MQVSIEQELERHYMAQAQWPKIYRNASFNRTRIRTNNIIERATGVNNSIVMQVSIEQELEQSHEEAAGDIGAIVMQVSIEQELEHCSCLFCSCGTNRNASFNRTRIRT